MSFEIFILIETHITEEKTSQAEKYFSNFNIYWEFAKRTSQFGRAVGGCIFCGKKVARPAWN